ncbi:hypothetical protein HWV62_32545 [Athelia sp. TMB]|nr:hypothetical protein HWV62_32545 [Athelia sp. TMB]
MALKCQLPPEDSLERFRVIAETLADIPTPPSSQPTPQAVQQTVSEAVNRLKRYLPEEEELAVDLRQQFARFKEVVDSIPTPRGSQGPEEEDIEHYTNAHKEITLNMKRKKIVSRQRKRPSLRQRMVSVHTNTPEIEAEEEADEQNAEAAVSASPSSSLPRVPLIHIPQRREVRKLVDEMREAETMEVSDVMALYTTPGNLSYADREAKAILRPFGGVQTASVADWREAFQHLTIGEIQSISIRAESSTACSSLTNLDDRLSRRHTVLENAQVQQLGQSIAYNIFDKMDAILFSEDYNLLGSNAAKAKWAKFRYASVTEGFVFPEIHNEHDCLFNGTHKHKFAAWKSALSKTTTARNRLWNLYRLFGPMIILDPSWTLQALHDHSGASRHALFIAAGEALIEDRTPTDHLLSNSLPGVERALTTIMETVAGPEAKARVESFLEAFATKIAIQSAD